MNEKEKLQKEKARCIKDYTLLGILYVWRNMGKIEDVHQDGSFQISDVRLINTMKVSTAGLKSIKKRLQAEAVLKFIPAGKCRGKTRYWLT